MIRKPSATHCLEGEQQEEDGTDNPFASEILPWANNSPGVGVDGISAPVHHAWDFGRRELNFSLTSIPQPSRC